MSTSLEITGNIIKIDEPVSGTSKAGNKWTKQTFVIETEGEYPKKIALDCFGKTVELLQNSNVGDNITVSFNIESREHKEKWYTNINAWRIVSNSTATAGLTPEATDTKKDPLTESQNQLPEDDLPF